MMFVIFKGNQDWHKELLKTTICSMFDKTKLNYLH